MIKVTITTYDASGETPEFTYQNEPFVLKVDTVAEAIANKLRYGGKVTGPNQVTTMDAGGFMTVCDYEEMTNEQR